MTSQSTTPADTLGISETAIHAVISVRHGSSDILDISETVHASTSITVHNTLNISETVIKGQAAHPPPINIFDISEIVTVAGELIQYDSWRSVPRFDNMLFLLCRTPVGEFDSYSGLTDMTLWTVDHDGLSEFKRIDIPSTNGWTSFSHPEWSPDGQAVVIAVETVAEYQLEVLDSSGWV